MTENETVTISIGRIPIDQITQFIRDIGSHCSATDSFKYHPEIIIGYPENGGLMQRSFSRGGPDMFVRVSINPEARELERFIRSYFTPPKT